METRAHDPSGLDLQTEAVVHEEDWDRMVGAFCGSFLHSFAWSRYIGRVHGPVYYATVVNADRPVAAGWYTIAGNHGRLPGLARRLQLETLPGFDPAAISPATVFRLVTELARHERCVSLTFGNSAAHYLAGAQTSDVQEKINFRLDLRMPLERILAGMHERHRARIRKAADGGMEVRALAPGQCRELAGALQDMFSCSLVRHLDAGKDRPRGEVCSISDITRDLVEPDAATIFAAFLGNRPVSCSVVGTFAGQARMLYAASSEEGYRSSASFLLLWRVIEHYHQLGTRQLDMGEVPMRSRNSEDPDHGLYRYKAGFGAETRLLFSGSSVTRPAVHTLATLLRNFRSRVKKG